jgi:glycosyltransferase involved in cell wall biosynthesis
MGGKKIAFYNSTECFSGLEKNTLRFIEWLEADGNEIVILSAEGTPITHATENKKLPLIKFEKKYKYFNLSGSYRLARILKDRQIGLLFIVRPRDILMASLTKMLFHRQLILIFFQQSNLRLKPHVFIYKLLFGPFNAWIVPSENIRNKILKMTHFQPLLCHVIAPCIDKEYYENDTLTQHAARAMLNLPEDRKIIGVIGRYNVRRKQDFLVRSIQLLRKHNFNVDLLVMGHSDVEEEKAYYNFLAELVKECSVEAYVHFRPYSEKMISFYKAIDIFVMNTVPEPYDLAIVKSMASNIPVVACYSGYHAELLGNGNYGLLYKPENLEDFTAKIIHLLTQPKLVNYVKNEARRIVSEKYDKVTNCRQIESLISQLLEKK